MGGVHHHGLTAWGVSSIGELRQNLHFEVFEKFITEVHPRRQCSEVKPCFGAGPSIVCWGRSRWLSRDAPSVLKSSNGTTPRQGDFDRRDTFTIVAKYCPDFAVLSAGWLSDIDYRSVDLGHLMVKRSNCKGESRGFTRYISTSTSYFVGGRQLSARLQEHNGLKIHSVVKRERDVASVIVGSGCIGGGGLD